MMKKKVRKTVSCFALGFTLMSGTLFVSCEKESGSTTTIGNMKTDLVGLDIY